MGVPSADTLSGGEAGPGQGRTTAVKTGKADRTPRIQSHHMFIIPLSRRGQIARREGNMDSARPEYTAELFRHFADLRDGAHGGATSRRDKERLFTTAVGLLDPHARQPPHEINTYLLLGTGEVTATGVRRRGGGVEAVWALSWPEQQATGINPIIIRAFYSAGAHHPQPRRARHVRDGLPRLDRRPARHRHGSGRGDQDAAPLVRRAGRALPD